MRGDLFKFLHTLPIYGRMKRFLHQQKHVISIHDGRLICALQGMLTPSTIHSAYQMVIESIPDGITEILFTGKELHYAGPGGISALSECIEKLQAHMPPITVKCAHMSPVIRSAWALGGLHHSDIFESDSAAAMRWFDKRRKYGYNNSKTPV